MADLLALESLMGTAAFYSETLRATESAQVPLLVVNASGMLEDSRSGRGGVQQVVHGSTLAFGSYNYLTIAVSPERLRLTLRKARIARPGHPRLWQVGDKRPSASLRVGRFRSVGTMTITADGSVQDRTGRFRR